MHSDQQQPSYRSDEPEYIHPNLQDEQEKLPPPLYICTHRNNPDQCDLWHRHPVGPSVYENYTPQTPCCHCGHVGTLKKVN